jgi:hypothetical protein
MSPLIEALEASLSSFRLAKTPNLLADGITCIRLCNLWKAEVIISVEWCGISGYVCTG